MIGQMLVNREGEEVGMWVYQVHPIYLGTDRDGNADYRFIVAEVPMLFKYPQVQINICDN